MKKRNINIATLIDGDNAEAKYLQNITEEISKYGRITIKRIYGDWSGNRMKKWKEKLSLYSLKPIQNFAYTKGKNATDIALVIDAMDILYREEIDAFCLVSSDSDFTGIANRIRESGLNVIGVGKKQTPKSFTNACDIFTFTESFKKEVPEESPEEVSEEILKKSKNKKSKKKKKEKIKKTQKIDIPFLRYALSVVKQENEEVLLSQLAESIKQLDPDFDSKKYGYKNFNTMFSALNTDFEMIYHTDNSTISIKDKKAT
ncbi:NYN domain-containing protein [Tenacibaculum pacificus]|uniref:NYN domain-containing protein n=1 Tax=Tenacibaculum pacificus TaxID=3018314 RepID=UPI0022F3EFEC|nr:NYN domain-containing protein [Tenacibaculum pacificus]WBX73244.1 NYN domain-containing protein [Tenacibaculum pacificus]